MSSDNKCTRLYIRANPLDFGITFLLEEFLSYLTEKFHCEGATVIFVGINKRMVGAVVVQKRYFSMDALTDIYPVCLCLR